MARPGVKQLHWSRPTRWPLHRQGRNYFELFVAQRLDWLTDRWKDGRGRNGKRRVVPSARERSTSETILVNWALCFSYIESLYSPHWQSALQQFHYTLDTIALPSCPTEPAVWASPPRRPCTPHQRPMHGVVQLFRRFFPEHRSAVTRLSLIHIWRCRRRG